MKSTNSVLRLVARVALVGAVAALAVVAVLAGRGIGGALDSAPPPQVHSPGAAPTLAQNASSGVVYSIADGDTMTVLDDAGQKVRIRLLGVDAPEVAHGSTPADCGGPEAERALRSMLSEGDEVSWVTDSKSDPVDVYGRVLAYVATAQRADVGLALIEMGAAEAWVPSGEPHPTRWSEYVAAQTSAQSLGVGSWATCPKLGR